MSWIVWFISYVYQYLFFLLLFGLTQGKGLGLGDVELAFLLGLFLGFPKGPLALYLAFLLGAIVGLFLLALKKVKFGQAVPFGPFLTLGGLLSYIWGEKIVKMLILFFQ